MIAFATGRNLTVEDPTNNQPQTIYGMRDDMPVARKPAVNAKTHSGTVTLGEGSDSIAGRAQLVEQPSPSTQRVAAGRCRPIPCRMQAATRGAAGSSIFQSLASGCCRTSGGSTAT